MLCVKLKQVTVWGVVHFDVPCCLVWWAMIGQEWASVPSQFAFQSSLDNCRGACVPALPPPAQPTVMYVLALGVVLN